MAKINVALIGKGYWGSKLERYIQENKNFNLKYLCDSKSDLEKVLNDKEILAVIEATRNETRYEIVKKALLKNKNVLTEKPLALKSNQCEELRKIASTKDVRLMTDYTHTFSIALKKAQQMVNKEKIGDICGIEMAIKHLGRFGGGSVYWLLGSHMLSILDMFVPIKSLDFERKDLVKHDGKIESGIILFKNKNKKFSGSISVSLNYPGKETKVTIYGKDGSIIYSPLSQPSLHAESYKRKKWTIGSKLPKKEFNFNSNESNNLRYTLKHFYDVLNKKEKSNIERAIQITKILERL